MREDGGGGGGHGGWWWQYIIFNYYGDEGFPTIVTRM